MPVHNRYVQFQSDQRQFFDELITEDWGTYKSQSWDHTRTFEVQQLFKRVQPSYVLDIGCGCGFRDIIMAQYPFVERVDAIDYSEQSVLKAEATYPHPKVRRFVADFNQYRPDRQYDLIVSFQVFEHLHNPEEYIRFCAQHCVLGKWIAICTPNRLRLDNRLRRLRGQPLTMSDPMHFKEYTTAEIVAMGRRERLKYRDHYGHGLHPFTLFKKTFLTRMDIERRTKYGYIMNFMASIIMVIMEHEYVDNMFPTGSATRTPGK
jgi:2-polyprenyl-3-methyl-5-hydroxy-6-metoxy-1,4-benzoquinol methylase